MVLMIDNDDSFTYNLVLYLGELGEDVKVFRNDEITLEEIAIMDNLSGKLTLVVYAEPGKASALQGARARLKQLVAQLSR
jgi:anthranilate/para-aminobenzoate synthase component II